jgi:hypothetical protein
MAEGKRRRRRRRRKTSILSPFPCSKGNKYFKPVFKESTLVFLVPICMYVRTQQEVRIKKKEKMRISGTGLNSS